MMNRDSRREDEWGESGESLQLFSRSHNEVYHWNNENEIFMMKKTM
jgi:hypothetical protein